LVFDTRYSTIRNVNYDEGSASVSDSLTGSTGGNQFLFNNLFQWTWSNNALSLFPFLKLDYLSRQVEAYSEQGNSGLPMSFSEQNSDLYVVGFGTQASYALNFNWGVWLPSIELSANSEIDGGSDPLEARFAFDTDNDNTYITETDLSSQLQSPVAEDIVDDTLVDAAPGQLPDTISIRPQVELGPRRFADSNVLINIEADVTAVEGSAIASSLWTQASGPQIQLPSVNTNSLIMITPFVATTRVLEFRHTVMDDQDRINSKTVSVVVRPLDSPIAVIGGVFNELDQVANFSIRLSKASDTPVTINYVTRNGTAEAGDDFEFTSGTVVIPPGTLSTDVSVPLIDDNIAEEDEISSAPEVATVDANGLVTAISAGTATITVTKDSDEMFSSGEASYLVQVMAEENTPPTIRFTPSGFGRGISFFLPGVKTQRIATMPAMSSTQISTGDSEQVGRSTVFQTNHNKFG